MLRTHVSQYCIMRQDISVLEDTWTAEEEAQLLDGVLQSGYGNWQEVCRLLPHKSWQDCMRHFDNFYVDCRDTRMPDVWPSDREAAAAGRTPASGGTPLAVLGPREDPPRPVLGEPPKDLAGYNPGRADFDQEFMNQAESDVSGLKEEVLDGEGGDELEKKIQWALLAIYNSRLRQRRRRKSIVREHSLLHRSKLISTASRYNGLLNYNRLVVFSQLKCSFDFDYLLESLAHQAQLTQKISRLQSFRKEGLTLMDGAKVFKRLCSVREEQLKDLSEGSVAEWARQDGVVQFVRDAHIGKLVPTTSTRRSRVPLDIVGLPGYQKMTPAERDLCAVVRLQPETFLDIKLLMTDECAKGGGLRLAKARKLAKIDVNKTRQIYDFLIGQGLVFAPKEDKF